MTDDNWFVIKDLDIFTDYVRTLTYTSFGDKNKPSEKDELDTISDLSTEDQKELELILSYDESLMIVKSVMQKQKNKKTDEIRYVLNDEIFLNLIQSLSDRMTSNILQGLVNKGFIEMAFDDKINDFIFWVKDENKEKPETD
jgi:hypothetical protein